MDQVDFPSLSGNEPKSPAEHKEYNDGDQPFDDNLFDGNLEHDALQRPATEDFEPPRDSRRHMPTGSRGVRGGGSPHGQYTTPHAADPADRAEHHSTDVTGTPTTVRMIHGRP